MRLTGPKYPPVLVGALGGPLREETSVARALLIAAAAAASFRSRETFAVAGICL